MQSRVRAPRLLLILAGINLSLLNFGCGGGGLPSGSQTNQTQPGTNQSLQTSMLGFVTAANGGEVRAILGVPGSSTLSHPLTIPTGVTGLYFAPGQRYAIAGGASGTPMGVMSFSSLSPGPVVEISGAISQPDIISFSPGGAYAAAYSAAEGRLQVISGLPAAPSVASEITGADLPSALRFLALGDDGTTLLGGTANSSVFRVAAGSAPQLVDTVGDLEGMAFAPQSENALVFDRGVGTLFLLQGVNSTPSSRSLAEGLTGLGGQVTLQVAAGKALITSATTTHLWQVNLQSLQVQDLQLPATATMLEPLRTSGRFLLSWQSGQPAWIVDATGPAGTLFFVPANTDVVSHQ